jgi:hypothetical protein
VSVTRIGARNPNGCTFPNLNANKNQTKRTVSGAFTLLNEADIVCCECLGELACAADPGGDAAVTPEPVLGKPSCVMRLHDAIRMRNEAHSHKMCTIHEYSNL